MEKNCFQVQESQKHSERGNEVSSVDRDNEEGFVFDKHSKPSWSLKEKLLVELPPLSLHDSFVGEDLSERLSEMSFLDPRGTVTTNSPRCELRPQEHQLQEDTEKQKVEFIGPRAVKTRFHIDPVANEADLDRQKVPYSHSGSHPDSPRPLPTSGNGTSVLKKVDTKIRESSPRDFSSRHRISSGSSSPRVRNDTVLREKKRSPGKRRSLRGRLMSSFIAATRKSVSEYAAAATAIISPSGDFRNINTTRELKEEVHWKEHNRAKSNEQTLSFHDSTGIHESTNVEYIRKESSSPKVQEAQDARGRSRSFPEEYETGIEHQESPHGRPRSCSQFVGDEVSMSHYLEISWPARSTLKAENTPQVAGTGRNLDVSHHAVSSKEREFSSIASSSIESSTHSHTVGVHKKHASEVKTKDSVFSMENCEYSQESLSQIEKDLHNSYKTREEEIENEEQGAAAKYKKKMSLTLDLANIGTGADGKIVPVRIQKKKGPVP
eukprot:jgi/Galph1/5378/GphlegSOOS_G4091.1